MVGAIASPPSSLTAAQPVSFMIRDGAGERLFGRALISSERHVDRDQRMPAAAHYGRAMGAHHLHRHRHGRRQAVDHLAQAVADQQHLAMRVEQLRHPHRVGGQHDQRLLGLGRSFGFLAAADRGDGHALAWHRRRRRAAGRGIDGEGRHGAPSSRCAVPQPAPPRPRPADKPERIQSCFVERFERAGRACPLFPIRLERHECANRPCSLTVRGGFAGAQHQRGAGRAAGRGPGVGQCREPGNPGYASHPG